MSLVNALKFSLACSYLALAGCVASAPTHTQTTAAANAPQLVSNLSSFEHNLRPTVLQAGQAMPHWSLRKRMAHYHVPGVAVAILRHGKVVFATGYGVREADTDEPVDADTLFSAGSVSKVITAAATLRLVAEGKLDLDRNVASYLTSWQIPPNSEYPNAFVTLRMLMSHTSGLNVHGFMDFPPNKPHPTLLQTLNGTGPAMNAAVHLIYKPGTHFHYSGGGVEVEQLVMEDVTGSSLERIASTQVFGPLGMYRSTFTEPLPAKTPNVAKAHNGKGMPVALPRGWQTFAGAAASGLWTSANDLGKFVGALMRSYQGTGDFLPEPIAWTMMTEVSPSPFGLGVRLGGARKTRFFYKGGANNDYRAWIEGHLATGDGLVVLTNGANGTKLYREIRNAVADMLGWSINRPVQVIQLGRSEHPYLDSFTGTYQVPDDMPVGLRQLADIPTAMEIHVGNGHIFAQFPGDDTRYPLLPLGPSRFVVPDLHVPGSTVQILFHQGANGRACAFTLQSISARAYYSKQAVTQ